MLLDFLSALGVVFLFLAVFFVCTFLLCRLIYSGEKNGYYAVIPGFPNDEQLVQKVFATYMQTNLFTLVNKNTVIVLDYGVSEQVRRECEQLLGGHSVLFCPGNELENIVGGCY